MCFVCFSGNVSYNRGMSFSNLIIKQIEVGPMQNFVYLVGDRETSEVAVVDPAWDIHLIKHEADKDDLKIVAALITHGHYDHTDGLPELQTIYDIPVYISENELKLYMPECKNLHKTKDHEKIRIGNIEIECLFTPGHAPGCQCFYVPGHMLTGDTLFIDGCGRCDLPGGDAKKMYNSLYDIILKLPDSTIIYPGHSSSDAATATIKSQKETNWYLSCKSCEEFLTKRMGC